MARPSTPLLSRERIADAALELADSQGGKFTLAQVARSLGVKAPSLYNHVSGHAEVIELIRERIHVTMGPRLSPDWSWQDAVRHVARSDRDSIGRYPWFVYDVMTVAVDAPAPLASVRQFAEILERAGFRPVDVLRVITSVDLLVVGACLDLVADEHVYGEAATREDDALGRALRANRSGRARADEAFEFALDRLVDSLERLLERTRDEG